MLIVEVVQAVALFGILVVLAPIGLKAYADLETLQQYEEFWKDDED